MLTTSQFEPTASRAQLESSTCIGAKPAEGVSRGSLSSVSRACLMALSSALLLLASQAALAGEETAWERVTRTDGIEIFARVVAGTAVREVKAVGRIDAPPGRVLAVITDVEAYTETMPYTEEARVVKREGNSTWMYTIINAPLVSRRDYCIKTTVSRLPNGTLEVSWVPANELAPAESAGVRVEINQGHWLLRPIDEGKATRAEYYVYTDPGGEIPRWIVNRANNSAVPDVVKAVRAAAASPRYADASHPLAEPPAETAAAPSED